jgi:hypothetical protein
MTQPASSKILTALEQVLSRTGRLVFIRRTSAIKASDRPAINVHVQRITYEDVLGDGQSLHTMTLTLDLAEQETTDEELSAAHEETSVQVLRVIGESLSAFTDDFPQMVQDVRVKELMPDAESVSGAGVAVLDVDISYRTPLWDHSVIIGQSGIF